MEIIQNKYYNEVIDESNKGLCELYNFFVNEEFELIKTKLLEKINVFKRKFLSLTEDSNEEFRNSLLLVGILHKAFYELIEIVLITKDEKWLSDKTTIKFIWHKLWNCRERTTFVSSYLGGEFINWIFQILKVYDEIFLENFGHGKYSSPTIISKSIICNICETDFRKCMHRAGIIYNGKICSPVRDIHKVEDVSMVHNPQDPRCRIWSWELGENKGQNGDIDMQIRTVVMVAFKLDDFLME